MHTQQSIQNISGTDVINNGKSYQNPSIAVIVNNIHVHQKAPHWDLELNSVFIPNTVWQ